MVRIMLTFKNRCQKQFNKSIEHFIKMHFYVKFENFSKKENRKEEEEIGRGSHLAARV